MSRNVGNRLWFDIRDYAPDHIDNNDGLRPDEIWALRQQNEQTYRNINLMAHLLWEIPYHAEPTEPSVHGRVDLLAQAMMANLGRSDWPSQLGTAARVMPAFLEAISNLDGAQNGVTVTQLFEQDSNPYPERRAIVDKCFELLDELERHAYDICLPFLTIQGRDPDNPPLPPEDEVGETDRRLVKPGTIEYQGPNLKTCDGRFLTLLDLYQLDVRQLDQPAIHAVQTFRKGGVFNRRSAIAGLWLSNEASPAAGQGNNYKCENGNNCKRLDNYYCSYDSEGQCSAMGG